MADRQGFDSSQKHTPLHGISLANFGGNLNFGPTLVPASDSPSISFGNQPTTTPTASRANADLEHVGEVDSFLGQQSTPQQQAQGPFQSPPIDSPGVPQGKNQSSPFFTMASLSSSAQDEFLSPATTTQGVADSPSPQIPAPKSPYQPLTAVGSGPHTPPRPSADLPQSFPPSPASRFQSPHSPVSNLPQTPPIPSSSLPQTPPQPGTSWPQTPPQPAGGWPQTSPNSSNLSQSTSPPSVPRTSPQSFLSPQQVQSSMPPAVIPAATVEPVQPHWFYRKGNSAWTPFSYIDSDCLEQALKTSSASGDRIVATDGGRYDVNLDKRLRYPLYWEEDVSVVRRCTWFYKGDGQSKLVPYMEDMAARLEAEFLSTFRENKWPHRVELSDLEHIMMHNANVMVHFLLNNESQNWSGEDTLARPRVVRRGVADIEDEIDDGEPAQIDHLIFVVHGIGPIADLNFRNIIECVNDFRKVSLQMLFDHHEELSRGRAIGRVEFLPVQWHSTLHNDSTGVDERLQSISLSSIRRLREFTNSTLLDILFYTSPTYCQTIVNTVGEEIERLLEIFKKRNPMFNGKYSVCGHSLGSSILFDILQHQKVQCGQPPTSKYPTIEQVSETLNTDGPAADINDTTESDDQSDDNEEDSYPALGDALTQLGLPEYVGLFESEEMDMETFLLCGEEDMKEMGIPMGPRKKLMGYLRNQKQNMEKRKLEREENKKAKAEAKAKVKAERQKLKEAKTISSPEVTSSTVLARPDLGVSYSLASVGSVEVVYQQGLAGTGQPYVEYPQLDLNFYALFALGSPIGMFQTVRGVDEIGLNFQFPTCPRLFNIFHPFDPVAYRIEPLVNPSIQCDPVVMPHHKGRKRMHIELRENLTRLGANLKQSLIDSARKTWESINEFARAHSTQGTDQQDAAVEEATEAIESPPDPPAEVVQIGQLNGGQRIDYVLQEKPIESLNEYLFALSSHVCYWVSEDTALFMLKEIYRD